MNILKLKDWCEQNWFYLKDKIDWDWDARYENWIPSVTSILGLIWDAWFDYVKKFHTKALNDAASKWTFVHDEAEHYFKKNSWVVKVNKNILKFHSLYVDDIISTEKRYMRWWVSWTIDLIAKIDYHRFHWIFSTDYKNSNLKSLKYKVQLWWYKYLTGYPGLIVYAKTKLEVVEVEDIYEDLFIELKDLFFKLLKEK
jgi:hypothetical protein